jgi:dUTPase
MLKMVLLTAHVDLTDAKLQDIMREHLWACYKRNLGLEGFPEEALEEEKATFIKVNHPKFGGGGDKMYDGVLIKNNAYLTCNKSCRQKYYYIRLTAVDWAAMTDIRHCDETSADDITDVVVMGHYKYSYPNRAHDNDAGLDLAFPLDHEVRLDPNQCYRGHTGFYLDLPRGVHALIKARSYALAKGIFVDGVIDSGYKGEWCIFLRNISGRPLSLRPGEIYAQVVFTGNTTYVAPLVVAADNVAEEENETTYSIQKANCISPRGAHTASVMEL